MTLAARAPGKLVVLGEYAVLDGACALVMAVDRHCRATIEPAEGARGRLEARAESTRTFEFAPGKATGSALVDAVLAAFPGAVPPWSATLDSSAFYSDTSKLGLGSSAAALVAFAGAYAAYARAAGQALPEPTLARLVEAHRAFQGGGSGLDVAAALVGGVIEYRLDGAGMPHIGSVRLPNSVGFAGVFAGHSASTPDFVAKYRHRLAEPPVAALRHAMGACADRGVAAAREDDGKAFLEAVAEYGRGLEALGRMIDTEIMTADHRVIGAQAAQFDVVYKVSGAGGGDVGLGFADDADALAAWTRRVAERGFQVMNMTVDERGLVIEECAE